MSNGYMRPTQRSRDSRTVTLVPARANSWAVIRPAAPAPTITKCIRRNGAIAAWLAGDDAPMEWGSSRSGSGAFVRGAERADLAGGVLQLLIAQLRGQLVLFGQRQQS